MSFNTWTPDGNIALGNSDVIFCTADTYSWSFFPMNLDSSTKQLKIILFKQYINIEVENHELTSVNSALKEILKLFACKFLTVR